MPDADPVGRGAAFARAALAGNPSDGYGGAVLALAFGDFRARAVARPASAAGTAGAGAEAVRPQSELVSATVARFARELAPAARGTAVEWSTTIPRSVGLGGSSAIVIATLRALCSVYGTALDRDQLATFALAVETEELGIAAGLQDRVAQSYGGVTFMDFGGPGDVPAAGRAGKLAAGAGNSYEPLHPHLVPPLVIGWRRDRAEDSGRVHSDLRERFDRREPVVRGAMAELAALGRRARDALQAGDARELARCLDGSFDARARMMELNPHHVEMIECARACGAGANYTGSGGAIVALCRDAAHRRTLIADLRGIGCDAITPAVCGS